MTYPSVTICHEFENFHDWPQRMAMQANKSTHDPDFDVVEFLDGNSLKKLDILDFFTQPRSADAAEGIYMRKCI